MSGLVLKLGPHERVLINGAVIENGEKRSRLAIMTPHANILRLRDAIHPEEVNTPVRRVCYISQLVLSGDADPADARMQLRRFAGQRARRQAQLARVAAGLCRDHANLGDRSRLRGIRITERAPARVIKACAGNVLSRVVTRRHAQHYHHS